MRRTPFNLLPLIVLLALTLPGVGASAAGGASPEALAMAFVQAFRAGDVDSLIALHAPDGYQDAQRTRGAWRTLVNDYRLSGYRVARLDGAERARLAQRQRNSTPLPIRKLVAQLSAIDGGEQLVLERYISAKDGRFYFVTADVR